MKNKNGKENDEKDKNGFETWEFETKCKFFLCIFYFKKILKIVKSS